MIIIFLFALRFEFWLKFLGRLRCDENEYLPIFKRLAKVLRDPRANCDDGGRVDIEDKSKIILSKNLDFTIFFANLNFILMHTVTTIS